MAMRPHLGILLPWCAFVVLGLLLPASRAQAVQKPSGGGFLLARNTNASDGRRTASGGLTLTTTVGEVGTSTAAGGGFRLFSGYSRVERQPGSVASITAVTKATGTMELIWVAPGLDGLRGDIVNGAFRVDYSSDPAHAFRPSLYKLEFSTTVVAGSTQTLSLQGLQPNTTYYTKIYLVDSRKFASEDSRRSDEATLASVPADAAFSKVYACRATLAWTIPIGGAAGYQADSSSTGFVSSLPGGAESSSATNNGLLMRLTLTGLTPLTTYFFRVASLNWQGQKNFSTVIATVTPIGVCAPVPPANLAASPDALLRSAALTWSDPADPLFQGVLVLVSTGPAPEIEEGWQFSEGQVLADNSLVKSTSALAGLMDFGLTLDTTYFYHLYSRYIGHAYSVSVSTSIFLDLPPMAPAGLTGARSADRSKFTLTWSPVTTNSDGSVFPSTVAPRGVELARYQIERSTTVINASWVMAGTVPVSALAFTDDVPDPAASYAYRVRAMDSFESADHSMIVDSENNVYAVSDDKVTRLKVPPGLAGELRAGSNQLGSDILIRAFSEPPDAGRKVFSAARFDVVKSPGNEALRRFQFSGPGVDVVMKYQVAGGRVVASAQAYAPAAASAPGAVSAPNAASNLGLYWNNGEKFIKLFGTVDTAAQTVSARTTMAGTYQIRALERVAGFGFDTSGLSNKMITPNGDGLNDAAVFIFENPRDSAISGKIFDQDGGYVADMTPGPVGNSLRWDGRANGRPVQGGVYIYQIRAEDKAYNGTVVVVR